VEIGSTGESAGPGAIRRAALGLDRERGDHAGAVAEEEPEAVGSCGGKREPGVNRRDAERVDGMP
jgi:hypothetical protein